MRGQMKAMARPFGTLFLIALAVALVGRVGLAVMDATGTLSYDYISAADVPILDVVCSILTGSALVAFMYAASLAMAVSTAGVALYGFLVCARRGRFGAARDGVSVGLGDGARGHRVPAGHGERDTLGRAGGVDELEAAGHGRCSWWRSWASRRSSARFWAQPP